MTIDEPLQCGPDLDALLAPMKSGFAPTLPTLASGLAQNGLEVALFLAPHLEQMRCLATSGTGMRLGSRRRLWCELRD